jgi:hypothetical protein
MVMNRQHITTAIEVLGGISVVIGANMIYTPLAYIVAGIGLIVIGGMNS